jgi:hypothetical protein
MQMPWGKHKGRLIQEVPDSYLRWMLLKCDLSPRLRQAVQQELGDGGDAVPPPPGLELRPLVNKWYGRMALKYHPDRGGTHKEMLVVNECRDALLKLIGTAR